VAPTSVSTPVHDLANEQEISLCSNNTRNNRGRGFLSASEDPRDSLLPTAVVGERQRIWARLVSAPSRSSWGVACSESTCRRVGVRLLLRAQLSWRSGRLSAQCSDPRKQLFLGPPPLRHQLSLVGLHFWICTGTGSRHRHDLRDALVFFFHCPNYGCRFPLTSRLWRFHSAFTVNV
jgi:hypothetical protein